MIGSRHPQGLLQPNLKLCWVMLNAWLLPCCLGYLISNKARNSPHLGKFIHYQPSSCYVHVTMPHMSTLSYTTFISAHLLHTWKRYLVDLISHMDIFRTTLARLVAMYTMWIQLSIGVGVYYASLTNICFSVAHTIHHSPILIVLQWVGGN